MAQASFFPSLSSINQFSNSSSCTMFIDMNEDCTSPHLGSKQKRNGIAQECSCALEQLLVFFPKRFTQNKLSVECVCEPLLFLLPVLNFSMSSSTLSSSLDVKNTGQINVIPWFLLQVQLTVSDATKVCLNAKFGTKYFLFEIFG